MSKPRTSRHLPISNYLLIIDKISECERRLNQMDDINRKVDKLVAVERLLEAKRNIKTR